MHTDTVDNTMKPRRAIALMSAGNLEGSLFYLLLSNMNVVKRTKAKPLLPMSDGVIDHSDSLSVHGKLTRLVTTNNPYLNKTNVCYLMMTTTVMTMLHMIWVMT